MLGMFLDFEATDKTPDIARVTQAAFSIFDLVTQRELFHYSSLMYDDINEQKIHPDAVEITGITEEQLRSYGRTPYEVLSEIHVNLHRVDYLIAHNGHNYDFPLLKKEFGMAGLIFPEENVRMKPIKFIDTKVDVPYPKKIETRKLIYLAAEHGFVNAAAHSARHDVDTMAKIFFCYDLAEILALASQKNIYIIANVTYATHKPAKERNYRWDGAQKKWWKEIKEGELKSQKEAPFEVLIDPDFKPTS